jgi:hypothetical protein
MFSANDIIARLRQTPFVPVRIIISSGQSFEIYHPDLILVGRRDMIIGIASKKNPATYESTTRVPIMHVTALEDLPAASVSDN